MKLAIMQPYLFPYLGYFQLITAVDKFVIYDDVAFIKQGWVNRNQILLQGKAHLFSVPLQNASSNRTIRETIISTLEYPRWKEKFLRMITLAYSKAPYYDSSRSLIMDVVNCNPNSIADLALLSIQAVCNELGIKTAIEPSSSIYENKNLQSQPRVIDICLREKATLYINPIGGQDLYSSDAFAAHGINLRFLQSRLPAYNQFRNEFVPALSIIDILMFNSRQEINILLHQFDLRNNAFLQIIGSNSQSQSTI
jgi:hypothetical protein